jgi:hypothetical protein
MTLSLCIVPVRFAATFTPLAQLAVTVPATDEAVWVVMSHFTSEQLPSGSPAMLGEPHAPANADAGELEEFPPVDVPPVDVPPVEDPPVEVEPAAPLFPEGAVGLKSFDVCSNAHPVASVEASSRLRRETFFMIGPYSFVSAHTVLVCSLFRSLKILKEKVVNRVST